MKHFENHAHTDAKTGITIYSATGFFTRILLAANCPLLVAGYAVSNGLPFRSAMYHPTTFSLN